MTTWHEVSGKRHGHPDGYPCEACDLERQLAEADGVVMELWGRLTKEEIDIMPEESKQRVYPYLARILKEE